MSRILWAVAGRVAKSGVCHTQNLSLMAHHGRRARPNQQLGFAAAGLPFKHGGLLVTAPDHPALWGEAWGDGVHAVLASDFRGAPGDDSVISLDADEARRFSEAVEATVTAVSAHSRLMGSLNWYLEDRRQAWLARGKDAQDRIKTLEMTSGFERSMEVLSDGFIERARARSDALDELPIGAKLKRDHAVHAAKVGAQVMGEATPADLERIEAAMDALVAQHEPRPGAGATRQAPGSPASERMDGATDALFVPPASPDAAA